jgi:hypothetical protein
MRFRSSRCSPGALDPAGRLAHPRRYNSTSPRRVEPPMSLFDIILQLILAILDFIFFFV